MTDKRADKLTDNMIADKLAGALNDAAPDMLDQLMAELGLEDSSNNVTDTPQFTKAVPRKRRLGVMIASCAAVMLLAVGGLSIFNSSREAFAVVGLDVNPSVEISIDSNDKVISAEALNSEGETILDGMKLKGSDVKVACNAVVGSMMAKGYLTDTSNSVLVSVRAKDGTKGREIEEQLAGDLNGFFEDSELAAAILGQYYEDDDALEDFAEMYGVSPGKAWLIRSIAAADNTKTPESLVTLSTQELILLAQEKKLEGETSYGSADKSQYITGDKAIETAFAKAGVDKSQATGIRCEFDAENGVIVYEVEFTAGGIEYEYDINAKDGSVVAYESERADADDADDDNDADDADDSDDDDDADDAHDKDNQDDDSDDPDDDKDDDDDDDDRD